jgi:hypothetical protein
MVAMVVKISNCKAIALSIDIHIYVYTVFVRLTSIVHSFNSISMIGGNLSLKYVSWHIYFEIIFTRIGLLHIL